MVEAITGGSPPSCPWQAYEDPVICEILAAYGACATGMGVSTALLLPADPPHLIWQGVNFYRHVSAKVRDHDEELERKNGGKRRG